MKLPEDLELKFDKFAQQQKKELHNYLLDLVKSIPLNIKEGDIIEDHIGKGIVKKMIYQVSTHLVPTYSVIFICDNLTKTGTISKREPVRQIWLSNLKQG